ncbi:putative lipoprotein YerB precursor [compost metagenome]
MKNYKVGYAYDAVTGLYKRSINDKEHIDLNNNEQLSGTNLVVLGANHKTLDKEGRLAVNLTEGGSAYLFQKGKVIEAEWIRSKDGMIRIVKNGSELPFVPGKTFFHIVPNSPTFAEHVTWVQS